VLAQNTSHIVVRMVAEDKKRSRHQSRCSSGRLPTAEIWQCAVLWSIPCGPCTNLAIMPGAYTREMAIAGVKLKLNLYSKAWLAAECAVALYEGGDNVH